MSLPSQQKKVSQPHEVLFMGDLSYTLILSAITHSLLPAADPADLFRRDGGGIVPPACPFVVNDRLDLFIGKLVGPGRHLGTVGDPVYQAAFFPEEHDLHMFCRVGGGHHGVARKRRKYIRHPLAIILMTARAARPVEIGAQRRTFFRARLRLRDLPVCGGLREFRWTA